MRGEVETDVGAAARPARVLLVGMSHVHAVRRALAPGERRDLHIFDMDRERRLGTGRDPLALLRDLDGGPFDVLCLIVRGNHHNVLGLFNHAEPFHLDGTEPRGRLIPRALMRALFERDMAIYLTLAREIVAAVPAPRRILLAPPPPIVEEGHLAATLGPALLPGLARGFSPPSLRRALYEMQCDVQRGHAAEIGAEMLGPPPESMDEAGFMRPGLGRDSAHGTTAYGRLVIDHLRRHVDR